MKKVPSVGNSINFRGNNPSDNLLAQKISQENILSYVNSLEKEKLVELEINDSNQTLKHNKKTFVSLLQTLYLGLLASGAFFPFAFK